MNNGLNEKLNQIYFSLILSGVTGNKLNSALKISEEEMNSLFILSKKHNQGGLICFALNLNGIDYKKTCSLFFNESLQCVSQFERQKVDAENLKNLLYINNIEYIVFKGSEISKFYFSPQTRYSVDIDVLVKKEKIPLVVKLLKANGYTKLKKSGKDILFSFPSGGALEVHYKVESNDKFNLTQKLWDEKKGDTVPKIMTLCYVILHARRHFLMGGCGLKYVSDVLAMTHNGDIDKNALNEKLKEFNAKDFYDYTIKLIDFWFYNKEADESVKLFGNLILFGGSFGNEKTSSIIESDENYGMITKIFLPYEKLCAIYPTLKGKKILTPVYQIKRWFGVFNSKKRRAFVRKSKIKVNFIEREKINNLKEKLGLKPRKNI